MPTDALPSVNTASFQDWPQCLSRTEWFFHPLLTPLVGINAARSISSKGLKFNMPLIVLSFLLITLITFRSFALALLILGTIEHSMHGCSPASSNILFPPFNTRQYHRELQARGVIRKVEDFRPVEQRAQVHEFPMLCTVRTPIIPGCVVVSWFAHVRLMANCPAGSIPDRCTFRDILI